MVLTGRGPGRIFWSQFFVICLIHSLASNPVPLINIEVLEIVIDGLFGTHRVFNFMGGFYNFLIGTFEILALLVLVSCAIFLLRRNVMNIKRFGMKEMKGWPKNDANLILIMEFV